MKNFCLSIFIALTSFVTLFAQAPQRMSYQSVIRNSNGVLLNTAQVGLRITILKDSPSGTPVYSEAHSGTTNANGLISLQIGGGTVLSGNFSSIEWGSGSEFFILTETDPLGGNNYTLSTTNQLLSVPYALYAERTRTRGKTTLFITGDMTAEAAAKQIENEAGPETEHIKIFDTTGLSEITITNMPNLMTIDIARNANLQSIHFTGLKTVYSTFRINSNPVLQTIDFLGLKTVHKELGISYNNALQTINFPDLELAYENGISVSYNLQLNDVNFPMLRSVLGFGISYNPALTSISLPELEFASSLFIDYSPISSISLPVFNTGSFLLNNTNITSLLLPQFVNCNALNLVNNNLLTSVNVPLMTESHGINISNNSQLSSININALTDVNQIGGGSPYYYFQNNALGSSQVNAVLNKFANITLPSFFVLYLKQIPPAPPTGQGIIDKQILVSQGVGVISD